MGTHQLIYIRTDGNKNIASGHLTRCLSIALACRQPGMDVHFLVSDEESCALLEDICFSWSKTDKLSLFPPVSETETSAPAPASSVKGPFPISRLQTARYDCPELEVPELTALLSLQKSEKPVLLIDSYFVTPSYLAALKPYAKIAYLDDLRLFDYPVDLLINYDVIPDSELPSYQASYQNAGRLLLGPSYTPLRSQFQGKQITIKNQIQNILVTTGGSDPLHFCLAFLHGLTALPFSNAFHLSGVRFHMVIGKLNTDKDALYGLAAALPFLQLHENVSDMAGLMLCCDFAISAAGTTLYELCALGIPSVSFTMADNQIVSAKAFAAAGAIPWAGDIRENPDEVLKVIIQSIKDSCGGHSCNKRKSAQAAMHELVDGSGASRIARALEILSES